MNSLNIELIFFNHPYKNFLYFAFSYFRAECDCFLLHDGNHTCSLLPPSCPHEETMDNNDKILILIIISIDKAKENIMGCMSCAEFDQ